jgi:probable rRNA maturation factor
MMLEVEASTEGDDWPDLAWRQRAATAVRAALLASQHPHLVEGRLTTEVFVKLSTDAEVRTLNSQYRGKDKPTNVRSFPMLEREDLLDLAPEGPPEMLGDIALAAGTCAREAAEKGVPLETHATHLLIHGLLHLAGHDHVDSDAQAEAMEALEIAALAKLGIGDPYGDRN